MISIFLKHFESKYLFDSNIIYVCEYYGVSLSRSSRKKTYYARIGHNAKKKAFIS